MDAVTVIWVVPHSMAGAHLAYGLVMSTARGDLRVGLSGGLTNHLLPGGGLSGNSLGSLKGGSCTGTHQCF